MFFSQIFQKPTVLQSYYPGGVGSPRLLIMNVNNAQHVSVNNILKYENMKKKSRNGGIRFFSQSFPKPTVLQYPGGGKCSRARASLLLT